MGGFHVLRNPKDPVVADVVDWLPVEGAPRGAAPTCPDCGRFVGPMPLLSPVQVELKAWGGRWDHIGCGIGAELLVSKTLSDAITTAGLRGVIDRLQVEIIRATARRRLPLPPEYVLLTVARGAAVVDAPRSVLLDGQELCPHCRTRPVRSVRSLVVEHGSWTGEDIFYPWGLPGTLVVTDRFREVCLNIGQNVGVFVPAEEYSFDFYRT